MEDELQPSTEVAPEATTTAPAGDLDTFEDDEAVEQPAEQPAAPEATETEAEAGDETETATEGQEDSDLKPESKHYYERQLEKKDRYIEQLETQLRDQYVSEGDGELEQRVRAVEANAYINEVKAGREAIVQDHARVLADPELAIFGPDSTNPELRDRVMQKFAEGFTKVDPNTGEIVGARMSLYDYLKDEAALIRHGEEAGTKKGQQAEASMRSAAVVPSANTRTKAEEVDAFDAEIEKY